MTDLSELLKVISDPKESQERLRQLEAKSEEVGKLLDDLEKRREEIVQGIERLAQARRDFEAEKQAAKDLRAEAQKLIDYHSRLGGELEARSVALDQRESVLDEQEAQLSVQVREAKERDEQSLATAERNSRMEADLRRRLAVLVEASKDLPS